MVSCESRECTGRNMSDGLVVVVTEVLEILDSRDHSIRVDLRKLSKHTRRVVLDGCVFVSEKGLQGASSRHDGIRARNDQGSQCLDRIMLDCGVVMREKPLKIGADKTCLHSVSVFRLFGGSPQILFCFHRRSVRLCVIRWSVCNLRTIIRIGIRHGHSQYLFD
jgi:hypothetical protein